MWSILSIAQAQRLLFPFQSLITILCDLILPSGTTLPQTHWLMLSLLGEPSTPSRPLINSTYSNSRYSHQLCLSPPVGSLHGLTRRVESTSDYIAPLHLVCASHSSCHHDISPQNGLGSYSPSTHHLSGAELPGPTPPHCGFTPSRSPESSRDRLLGMRPQSRRGILAEGQEAVTWHST